ncbi:MAG: class I SAM-dependent methyltransferase [Solirubrobacteraceae bacterium]
MIRTSLRRNRRILVSTVAGFSWGVVHKRPELRHHVVRDAWTIAKRFAAHPVENIEFREVPALEHVVAEGYVDDPQRLVIAALVNGLGCKTFFEIGTNRGRTTWTVARSNPELELYTLDAPPELAKADTRFALDDDDRFAFRDESCGEAFRGTPEANRITQLWADSAAFDYSPYRGTVDFVYIDAAHTYDYVKSDSAHAMEMVSPNGVVAWDDYTTGAGVYEAVIELAKTLDRPMYHLFGTRMALYGRGDFVTRLPADDFASLPSV